MTIREYIEKHTHVLLLTSAYQENKSLREGRRSKKKWRMRLLLLSGLSPRNMNKMWKSISLCYGWLKEDRWCGCFPFWLRGCLLLLSPDCCQGIRSSGMGGWMKAAGVERCDDSDEMRGKSCVSVAGAFNEITWAQTSNNMGFEELRPVFLYWR